MHRSPLRLPKLFCPQSLRLQRLRQSHLPNLTRHGLIRRDSLIGRFFDGHLARQNLARAVSLNSSLNCFAQSESYRRALAWLDSLWV